MGLTQAATSTLRGCARIVRCAELGCATPAIDVLRERSAAATVAENGVLTRVLGRAGTGW